MPLSEETPGTIAYPNVIVTMLVVATEELVDMEQEGNMCGLLQVELLAGKLNQLRGHQLRLVVM